ncbi:unnamed protein product [Didymodactylos carnosus]|uniref:Uncharacterized protein n=1 Tax=Didymodactylos carnosus TaxID=1234261 RepID=A0A815FS57_9BILA|nr:unnamed protein product [Didymodactylos carnosus]CAF1329921.1 unnamed protein product [Didymodactylos carnosus]CAF3880043.1 unnamed protein product [Didymodactylos carnosus]CAF4182565.1 unnamed protein product [Didymodactylos carnosus]
MKLEFFSDGTASQFRQRFMFHGLAQLACDYSINLSWNLFATSHSKEVVDDLGSSIKRLVWSAVFGDTTCTSAEDFGRMYRKTENKTNNSY